MNKIVKNVVAYATMATLGAATLTGCGKEKEEKITKPAIETVVEPKGEEIHKGDKKVFEPHKHVFCKRINGDFENGYRIEAPEGYRVLTVTNRTDPYYNTSKTLSCDVWYENEEEVEATAIYDESLKKYDGIYEYDIFIGESEYLSKGLGEKIVNYVNNYIYESFL
jgi:hypothetical protein